MGSIFGMLLRRGSTTTLSSADRLYQAGLAAAEIADLPAAVAFFDHAVATDPSHADAFYKRGNVLKDLGDLEAAVGSYDRAIAARSDYIYAYCNRGVLQHRLCRLEEALESFNRALQLNPKDGLTHYNRALLLQDLTRWDEAVASYDAAIDVNPNHSEARYNRSLAQLYLGRFEEGWQGYEWRWRHAQQLSIDEVRHFSAPLWLGQQDIAGKRLLLHAEGGLGDTVQFCRYASLCAAKGAIVLLEVQPSLVTLLRGLPGVAAVFAAGGLVPDHDYHTPLMSLPLAFGTTPQTVPLAQGYLEADPATVATWHKRLGPRTRPRIGLCWSGNPQNWIDARRSIALSAWAPHLPAGLSYICLQREVRPADQAYLDRTDTIHTIEPSLLDFSNTAALSQCLDLCISVDSSPAHLSGALGNKTWLMLARSPDWRWLRDCKDTTPWYSHMRLYRQRQAGEWKDVFSRVAHDLRETFREAG